MPLKRVNRGTAAGSLVTAWPSMASRTWRKVAARRGVKRWSRAWGETVTPRAAAIWVSSCRLARGLASQPKTRVWTRVAPENARKRWTQPLRRAACSATSVNRERVLSAMLAILVIGTLLGRSVVDRPPTLPVERAGVIPSQPRLLPYLDAYGTRRHSPRRTDRPHQRRSQVHR